MYHKNIHAERYFHDLLIWVSVTRCQTVPYFYGKIRNRNKITKVKSKKKRWGEKYYQCRISKKCSVQAVSYWEFNNLKANSVDPDKTPHLNLQSANSTIFIFLHFKTLVLYKPLKCIQNSTSHLLEQTPS